MGNLDCVPLNGYRGCIQIRDVYGQNQGELTGKEHVTGNQNWVYIQTSSGFVM